MKIDGAKLEQIGHIGFTVTRSGFPPEAFTDEKFFRAALANMLEQLLTGVVCPAVDKDGKPLSPDYIPTMAAKLKDDRTVAVSLVISQVNQ